MDFQNYFKDAKNVQVSTFVEDGILYLSLAGDIITRDKNEPVNARFVFPKIGISKFKFEKNTKYEPTYEYKIGMPVSPVKTWHTEATIAFQVLENEAGELFSIEIDEPEPKEMTIEEIEKELGYKIKVTQ